MPTVLLTAFEPYDIWKENSSWLALMELTKNLPDVPKLVTRRYPVDFSAAQKKLAEDLKQNYDYALHVGQAPGSSSIRLEAIGLNIGGTASQSPDQHRQLDPNGPTAYRSDLPLSHWATRLRFAGIPAGVSYHAGTYLCNALLYLSLHYAKINGYRTRSAFIHLPLTPHQVVAEGREQASMTSETAVAGLRLILSEIAQGAGQTLYA
jgi:pyroglutamyl-peptidase